MSKAFRAEKQTLWQTIGQFGKVAKSLRLALSSLVIQKEYGYSDEETVLQIQENPYLQYFCGYSGFDDSRPPFDASLMVHFRKRITSETLAEINEMIIQEAQQDSDDDTPKANQSKFLFTFF